MVSVSGINNSAALLILASREAPGSAFGFLGTKASANNPLGLLVSLGKAFTENAKLQQDFEKFYKKAVDEARQGGALLTADAARHSALVDTIMEHRGAFPPEEFSIRTDTREGEVHETKIPPAVMMQGRIYKKEQTERVADFEKAQEEKKAEEEAASNPDPAMADLVALGKIIDTITLDGGEKDAPVAVQLLKPREDAEDGASDTVPKRMDVYTEF